MLIIKMGRGWIGWLEGLSKKEKKLMNTDNRVVAAGERETRWWRRKWDG